MSAIMYCQEMFPCEILSIMPQRRLEKFEIEHCNIETILIMFLVKLRYCVYVCMCLFMLCVYARFTLLIR